MDGSIALPAPAASPARASDDAPAIAIAAPVRAALPVVVASPHSGRDYPADFLDAVRLDPLSLRRSEDCYVDEIFSRVPDRGAPLLSALFPRAFVDVNREAFELDPEMFDDALPAYVNTRSPRVAAGLGTIARVVAQGQEIYGGRRLRFAEAVRRVDRFYNPYHAALRRLVDEARARFGRVLLIDCHSMPSCGPPAGTPAASADVVLGDCYGTACAAALTAEAEGWLRARGYTVVRNAPYAGGFTTRHYGRPRAGIHALQIELNRALYMDEATMARKPYLAVLAAEMADLVETLGRLEPEMLLAA